MSHWNEELEKNLARLQALHQEVRVKIHLATMDAKDSWREIEPRVDAVMKQAGESASTLSHAAVSEAVRLLERLRDSLP